MSNSSTPARCRICSEPIPSTRHPNAVTCGDVCAAENDLRNRRRINKRLYERQKAARASAGPAAAAATP